MLSPDQGNWIDSLSDESKVKIVPYDKSCQEKFEQVRNLIWSKLGKIQVEHCGATSLGISGQDEIDVYVPVSPELFNSYITTLTGLFGETGSHYPLRRARFTNYKLGKRVDVFVINKQHIDWLNSTRFENYLKHNRDALWAYEKIKESGNGLSTREYYRRKIEFINDILEKDNNPLGGETAKW